MSFKKKTWALFFPLHLFSRRRMCQGSGCAWWYWLIIPWWKNSRSHRTQKILQVCSLVCEICYKGPSSPWVSHLEKTTKRKCLTQSWTQNNGAGGRRLQNATYYIKHKSIDLFIQQPRQVINLTLESQQAQGQSVITPPTAINGIFTMMSLIEDADRVLNKFEQAPTKCSIWNRISEN